MITYIEIIPIALAISFVKQHHYSKIMPRITKISFGGYENNRLVGIMTLGYGTRPLHTIKK